MKDDKNRTNLLYNTLTEFFLVSEFAVTFLSSSSHTFLSYILLLDLGDLNFGLLTYLFLWAFCFPPLAVNARCILLYEPITTTTFKRKFHKSRFAYGEILRPPLSVRRIFASKNFRPKI